jgi:hypothetical protein
LRGPRPRKARGYVRRRSGGQITAAISGAYSLRGTAELIDPFIGVDRAWMSEIGAAASATQIRRRKTTPSASGLASHILLSEAGVHGAVLPLATRQFEEGEGTRILPAVGMIRAENIPHKAPAAYRINRWISSE